MAIMAAGLLVVLISGGIDISFAAIAAVSQYLMATLLVRFGGNWLVAFGLAAVFGALLGVVNALLIYYLRALAVIVTISTTTFYFAMLMFLTDGKSIHNLPDWFTADLPGVSSYSFGFVTGLIILIGVSATAYAAKRQQKRNVRHAH
jgi:simple sugar transport system permease protein